MRLRFLRRRLKPAGDRSEQQRILRWLLDGDPALRFQVLRDLLPASSEELGAERCRIASEGWGARLLALQAPDGLWAGGLYSPKWTSTTYTMLLLRRLGLQASHPQARKACLLLLERGFYADGGINFFASLKHSETCVTGMVLSILAHFRFEDERLRRLAAHLLQQQMGDGGWNCQSYSGARHSSLHTTINVLEGLREYEKLRAEGGAEAPSIGELRASQQRGREFLLVHRLYRSHRSGQVIDGRMTRLSFPPRWRYDVLRALDYFQECGAERDPRAQDAVELLLKKRRPDGSWPLQNRHPGRAFFELEQVGRPSRWNTLRALRVLNWYRERLP